MSPRSIESPFAFFHDKTTGKPLENGKIFIGTVNLPAETNEISVFFDPALTIPASQPIRTIAGFPVNNGSPVTFYAATDFSIAVQDKNSLFLYRSPSQEQRISSDLIAYLAPRIGAVSRSINSRLDEIFYTADYGAVGGGLIDDTAAVIAAKDAVESNGGGTLFLSGIHLMTADLDVIVDSVVIDGASRETAGLKAGANNLTLIHFSASNGGIGRISFDADNKTGCSAFRMTPQDETQTTTLVNQNNNVSNGFEIKNSGFVEGLVLQAGPDVATADSGCFFNYFGDFLIEGCIRDIFLKDGPNASSSGCNRNTFVGVINGRGISNVGIEVESGATNSFIVPINGVSSGTSPSATPTAIKVPASGLFSGANNENEFTCKLEGNTRDLDLANNRTNFVNTNVANLKALFTEAPQIMIGGANNSSTPEVTQAYVCQANSQLTGFDNGVLALRPGFSGIQFQAVQEAKPGANTLDDYKEIPWTPTITASTPGSPTYSNQQGTATKVGRMAYATCEVTLSGGTLPTGSSFRIAGLPFTSTSTGPESSNASVYLSLTGMAAGDSIMGSIPLNSTDILIRIVNGNNGATALPTGRLTSSTLFEFNIAYVAA